MRVRITRSFNAPTLGKDEAVGMWFGEGDELAVDRVYCEQDGYLWVVLPGLTQDGLSTVLGLLADCWTVVPTITRGQAAEAPKKTEYTVAEVCSKVTPSRSQYTVRQWCHKGQISATKDKSAGRTGSWMVPAEEVERLNREGWPKDR